MHWSWLAAGQLQLEDPQGWDPSYLRQRVPHELHAAQQAVISYCLGAGGQDCHMAHTS